jgi:hypothetical protein
MTPNGGLRYARKNQKLVTPHDLSQDFHTTMNRQRQNSWAEGSSGVDAIGVRSAIGGCLAASGGTARSLPPRDCVGEEAAANLGPTVSPHVDRKILAYRPRPRKPDCRCLLEKLDRQYARCRARAERRQKDSLDRLYAKARAAWSTVTDTEWSEQRP